MKISSWWSFDVRQSLHDDAKKQCRLEIRLNGLEYFLYNNIGRYKRMRRLLAKKKADADGNVIVDLPEVYVMQNNNNNRYLKHKFHNKNSI